MEAPDTQYFTFLCNIGEGGGMHAGSRCTPSTELGDLKKKIIILIIVHEMKCAKEAFEFPELLEGHI